MCVLVNIAALFASKKLPPGMSVTYSIRLSFKQGDHGSTVVKVLCCKSEGHWFDPSWCHWNFSLS